MTPTVDDALRKLALKVLAHRQGAGPAAEAFAAAARQAYDDLAREAAPLIGQVGIDAVTDRAIHVAQRKYSWLADAHAPGQVEGPFSGVVAALERQAPPIATEAAAAVFATLAGLLITFIGEPLTMSLLRKAWPEAFSWPGTEDYY